MIKCNGPNTSIPDTFSFSPVTHLRQSSVVGWVSSDKSTSWNILLTYIGINKFKWVRGVMRIQGD